jgi:CheY-like chemotaxis protein
MKPAHEPGRMLVVDDNRVNRLLLTHALEQNGHHVSTAENGRIGMEMLKSQAFDVILLDIDMPEMNGFEVLEALLKDNELRDLPVIMTSASDELDRVVKCIEMGAEDYLVKPLNPVLLRARVNTSLEKKTTARPAEAVVPHLRHSRSGGTVAARRVFTWRQVCNCLRDVYRHPLVHLAERGSRPV